MTAAVEGAQIAEGVMVVGESLIDVVTRGHTFVERPGGSPANVALGLGRLGRFVRFHTSLARDERGTRISEHLRGSGVVITDGSWVLDRRSTASATIGPDGSAQYSFEIDGTVSEPQWQNEEIVHIGSISMFMQPGAEIIADFVEGLPDDVIVSIDPNIRPALVGTRHDAVAQFERLLTRADIVKLSDEDASWMYPRSTIDMVLDHLLDHGVHLAAATLGRGGADLATAIARVHLDAPEVVVADTIGAGDTFMSALLSAAVLRKQRLPHADEVFLREVGSDAVTAAAITVKREGADLPWAGDLLG